jgi:hypothetical protein
MDDIVNRLARELADAIAASSQMILKSRRVARKRAPRVSK